VRPLNASDKEVFRVAIGCIIAFALWKGTRESWFLSLCGLFVIVATVKFTADLQFPANLLGWTACAFILGLGKHLFVGRPWKERLASFNQGFKEFRDSKQAKSCTARNGFYSG
jgi:hypothetical protein